ncbi:hypothetical protein ACSAZK_01660 [Methanosarcina sp. Mfa9]|uniref:hypothetical protein n=1 Tax=Methanosarcina sp. Mfa9 TaxID=3439063 RepID=UPI003F875AA8
MGDFVKFGLLNYLLGKTESGFYKLGVNWYLVPDESNNDGKFITYLNPKNQIGSSLKKCNPSLYEQLYEVVLIKRRRYVLEIEDGSVLPDTTLFFHELFDFSNKPLEERISFRRSWHLRALTKLKESDIVFLDPDNGVENKGLKATQKKSAKQAVSKPF